MLRKQPAGGCSDPTIIRLCFTSHHLAPEMWDERLLGCVLGVVVIHPRIPFHCFHPHTVFCSLTLSHTHFRLLTSFPSLSARLSARLRGAETPPYPCPCMCSS